MKTRTWKTGTWMWKALVAGVALTWVVGCAEDVEPNPDTSVATADPMEAEAPLSDYDSLFEGAPSNDSLPEDGKFDTVYPKQFDVVDTQSPVKSQGRRGVCSIFSTTALMEHLYIKEGSITMPDFSEQFLQWSAKNEVRAFRNTGGSNANSNLKAISRFGIVEESVWPYEPSGWGVSNDPECTGDSQPTKCYTNGEPPAAVLEADRFTLPNGRYVNARSRSIKGFMTENNAAVVVGLTFFYQSWNHRGSKIPVNSDYWSEGYVLYPNEKDKELSLEKRAGHSVLIVGWDDELTVQSVDGEGNLVVDANGDPVTETGFFIIKNSWGTSGFGIRNKHGAGYGYISKRYVEEYGSVYGSGEPKVELKEVCDDGIDNDRDSLVDCDDDACSVDPVCLPTGGGAKFNSTMGGEVPDNTPSGVSSSIEVDLEGTIESISVNVDITHSYRGDLIVNLTSPDGREEALHVKEGGSQDDLRATFTPAAFVGGVAKGTWTLTVIDSATGDTGTLNSWGLEFGVKDGEPEICGDGFDNDANGALDCADAACSALPECAAASRIELSTEPGVAIPDNDSQGVTSTINVAQSGTISDLAIDVDISHTFRADLIVKIVHPTGATAVLFNQELTEEANLVRSFNIADFNGLPSDGDWSLEVVDGASQDEGTLNSWGLKIDVQ